LTYLINDLHITSYSIASLYSDNQVVRHIIVNSNFHKLRKHIDIDYHVVREKLQCHLFHLQHTYSVRRLIEEFIVKRKLFINRWCWIFILQLEKGIVFCHFSLWTWAFNLHICLCKNKSHHIVNFMVFFFTFQQPLSLLCFMTKSKC